MPDALPLPKVLVVNDDASTLLALSSVLTAPPEGPEYEVFMVQSGEEALREVLKHDFAVILLDVSMPSMDGFETADAIHSHPRSASVPIIFITAYRGDELNRLKGYQKGAADYLFAPFIPQIVQAKVAVFVELNLKSLELERKTEALQAINGDLRIQRLMDLEKVNAALQAEVQERRLAEQRATELATRDALTGLYNRHLLLESLTHALLENAEQNSGLALLFISLDKFKAVNNNYGYQIGDELLRHLAKQWIALTRPRDLVARVGGDEFVLMLRDFSQPADALAIAEKIVSTSAATYDIDGFPVKISASVGVSFYPKDGETAEALFKNADLAAAAAKQSKPGSIQVFHNSLSA